jgi:hypothetical protein
MWNQSNDRPFHPRARCVPVVLAALGGLGINGVAQAEVIEATWIGAPSGQSWHNPANWSSGTIPNNVGSTSYRAFIGPGGGAIVRQWFPEVTLDAISVSPGSRLEASSITVVESTQINGTFDVYSFNYYLRLLPGVELNGNGSVNVLDPGGGSTLPARVFCDGGPLVIGSGISISGNGRVGDLSQPTINNGRILGALDSFNPLIVTGSSITNNGVFQAGAGRFLGFGGTYTRAQLGNLVYEPGGSGGFVIKGTLLNDGQVLQIDTDTGPWFLSGTIRGGAVHTSAEVPLIISYGTTFGGPPATFDGVTLNGRLSMGNAVRLYLADGVLRGNADIQMGSPAIEGPSQILPLSTFGPLVIESGVKIHGGGNDFLGGYNGSGPGSENSATTNLGTIHSDNHGVLSIRGQAIHNGGIFRIDRDCVLSTFGSNFPAPPTVTFDSGGRLEITVSGNESGGHFIVSGTLDLTTSEDFLDLALSPGLSMFTYYRIATTTSGVLGKFDHITPGFDVLYVNQSIYVAAVPEASLSMPALLLATLLRRRR